MYKNFLVNFHKGLRQKGSPRIFEDGECSIAQDCYFDEIGNIYSRKFINKIKEFDREIKTIFPYGDLVISLINGSLYKKDGTIIATELGLNKLSCMEYNNILYLGTNRYDGTNFQTIGNVKPTATPAVTINNTEITDCNTAFTASTGVTASVEEHDFQSNPDDLTDIKACKLVIADSFTTGLLAYYNFTAKNLSSYTHVGFWIKSDTNINSGVLQLVIDNTSGCASPLETLDIPALNINEWTWVSLDLSTPANLTAVISVGLKAASDPGAITVRLDRIIATEEGGLDGAYYYKYTYVDSNGKESNASPASAVINAKQEKANVVVTASSVSKVDYINLYRLGGSLTDYYYVTQVANTTQTIVDYADDNDLDILFDADANDAPPSGLTYLQEHYERLIGSRDTLYPNSVMFTEEYEPEYWGEDLSQQYLISNSDECTGLLSWGRYVIYCKKNRIYVCEGADPTTWHIRRSDSCYGNIAPWALKFYKAPIILNYSGLMFFDGNSEVSFSDKIRGFFDDNKAYLPNSIGEVFDNKYYLAVGNTVLVYDFILKIFYTYDLSLSELCYNYKDNYLYAGDSDNNLVTLENSTNVDLFDSVNFKIKSKAYPLHDIPGYPGNLKDFIVSMHTYNQIVTLNVYIDEVLKDSIDLSSNKLTRIRKKFDATMKGNFAEFEFVYSGSKQIEIHSPMVINPNE